MLGQLRRSIVDTVPVRLPLSTRRLQLQSPPFAMAKRLDVAIRARMVVGLARECMAVVRRLDRMHQRMGRETRAETGDVERRGP